MDPIPLFSRASDMQQVELRQLTPRSVIDIVDAIGIATHKTRSALVNEILLAWAKQKAHEASLIARITNGNPLPADAVGEASEQTL